MIWVLPAFNLFVEKCLLKFFKISFSKAASPLISELSFFGNKCWETHSCETLCSHTSKYRGDLWTCAIWLEKHKPTFNKHVVDSNLYQDKVIHRKHAFKSLSKSKDIVVLIAKIVPLQTVLSLMFSYRKELDKVVLSQTSYTA